MCEQEERVKNEPKVGTLSGKNFFLDENTTFTQTLLKSFTASIEERQKNQQSVSPHSFPRPT